MIGHTQKNVYVYYIDVALTDRLSSPSLVGKKPKRIAIGHTHTVRSWIGNSAWIYSWKYSRGENITSIIIGMPVVNKTTEAFVASRLEFLDSKAVGGILLNMYWITTYFYSRSSNKSTVELLFLAAIKGPTHLWKNIKISAQLFWYILM